MSKSSVLVVDDTEMNVDILSKMLDREGFEVYEAYDGPNGLALAREKKPDIVLLDVMMPGMDGFEVCKQMQADVETNMIPVIFLSALTDPMEKIKGLEVGGVDYIAKPFHVKEVLARINTHLTIRRQQKQLEENYNQILRTHEVMRTFLSESARKSIEEDIQNVDTGRSRPRRKVLTVMFTDIANFTTISETLHPEITIRDLTLYTAILSEVVHLNHGEVDKFLGDGMLAFFDKAADAVKASYGIQEKLLQFNFDQDLRGHPRFDTRIGLATGGILQAQIGFTGRREVTIIGDRVNTASRLQGLAPLGGVLMDEETYIAAGRPKITTEEELALKGKNQLEMTYSIDIALEFSGGLLSNAGSPFKDSGAASVGGGFMTS